MFNFFANHHWLQGDFRIQDMKIQQQLGHGNAYVYAVTIKKKDYALKQIQIKTDYQYQNFLRQISSMKELSSMSQWIVRYQGYLLTRMERNQYDRRKYAYIVMQRAEMNLEQYLNMRRYHPNRLQTSQIQYIVRQILQALTTLQQKGVAHCDIKPQNILIMNQKLHIKLCDVGSCKVISKQSLEEATILGTVPFLAPELIKIKSTKILGNKAFISDVFSFGLVMLYIITLKKFKSNERLQIQENTYMQVIKEWMKLARQLTSQQSYLGEILKMSLQFNEYKRCNFKQLNNMFEKQLKKSKIQRQMFIKKLQQSQQKQKNNKNIQNNYFSSQPTNQLNLFRTRKIQKVGFSKTIANNTNGFKLKNRNSSPIHSPIKRAPSIMSNSPSKMQKNTSTLVQNMFQFKKVVYFSQQNRHFWPQIIEGQQQKNFILGVSQCPFKKAQSITILSNCTYDVFYNIVNVSCKRIFIQTINNQVMGVSEDAPILNFSKIRVNYTKCQMIGGFENIFRIIANENLQLLQLRLNQTQIDIKQLIFLLQKLSKCPLLHTLLLSMQRIILSQQQHILITQKLAKLNLKKLSLIMRQCYIQYEEASRWLIPKTCQILMLDYTSNLLKNTISNLNLSLSTTNSIKELYLNFENNGLTKGQVNMIVKSITKLQNLQRLSLNIAFNKIEETNYLQTNLILLKKLNYLQLKLHRTDISIEKTLQLISCLKQELFQLHFSLKMIKFSCDRNLPISLIRQKIEEICQSNNSSFTKGKLLRSDVVGFDNNCYVIFIKKNEKAYNLKPKGAAVKKSPKLQKLQLLPKISTVSQGLTMSNFHSNNKLSDGCQQLHTSTQSFNNYMCVTCCEQKQIGKNIYYCKFCMTSCMHRNHKQHYFVKVSQSTRCICAYSGQCCGDSKAVVCGDKMGASLKKQMICLRCETSFCIVCVQLCKDSHREWIKQVKGLSYFQCKSKIKRFQY